MRPEIVALLAKRLHLPAAEFGDAVLLVDVGVDSLDRAEIALELDEKYEIEISDEEIEAAATVADLVELVTAKAAARAA